MDRRGGEWSIAELLTTLARLGLDVGSTHPYKAVFNAVSYEKQRGRIQRTGRGRYRAGSIPQRTRMRLVARLRSVA